MEQESKILFKDFSLICRVCLIKQNLQVFPKNILEMYDHLVNIQDSDNTEMPQNVCTSCVSQLEDILIFSERCRNTEVMLNRIYAARSVEQYNLSIKLDPNELYEFDDKFEVKNSLSSPSSSEETKTERVWNEEITSKNSKVKKKIPIKCDLCNKNFYGKAAFSNHSRMHKQKREPKKFLCNYCGKNFIKNSHLDRHIRSHTGIKPHKCQACSKSFAQSNDLKRHLLTHTREKVFKCPQCPKSFHQKSVMDNHLSTHMNERNIPCNICDKKFTLKSYLDVHMRTHTGMKPFECTQCLKQFHQKSGLNNHILTHTGEKPFKCSTCNKSFIQSNHLKEHSRIHSGEKPFICSYCGKTFAYSSTLKVHLRQHTGEKPFICTFCKKGFHDASNLRRHIYRHHTPNKNSKSYNAPWSKKQNVRIYHRIPSKYRRKIQLIKSTSIEDVDRSTVRILKLKTGKLISNYILVCFSSSWPYLGMFQKYDAVSPVNWLQFDMDLFLLLQEELFTLKKMSTL